MDITELILSDHHEQRRMQRIELSAGALLPCSPSMGGHQRLRQSGGSSATAGWTRGRGSDASTDTYN